MWDWTTGFSILLGKRSAGSVHVHSLPRHGAYQQRVRTHAAQGGNTPKDTPEACNRRRKDHVRYHNDVSTHVGQDGAELVRKTVRSILGDPNRLHYINGFTYKDLKIR